MNWREMTLGEAIHIKHGFAFKSKWFTDSGKYVVLTPGNFHEVGGFRLRPGKDRYYSGDIPEDFILEEDSLIVAMTEQGPGLLGSSALIPGEDTYLHNQRLGLVDEIDEEMLSLRFLYYLFNTYEVRGQISSSASGVKVRHTSPDRIYRVKVSVPSVKSQEKIASILSAYDDLIENNSRRIQLLEESARLLYKEWFVRLRFPGHEHVKIVDGVPEGWERKLISEVCETVGGGTPKTKVSEYWGDEITWVVPTDITRNDCLYLTSSARSITEKGLKESSAKMIPPFTILMTSRASVGYFAMMDHEVCTNQGFINIIPSSPSHRMYFLFNLMSRVEEIRSNAKGTTYPEISKGRFRSMDIVIPPNHLISEFCTYADNLFAQICCLKKQTEKTLHARDLLLPRLMNGEVAV
jgi:type I restriction enzyme S subunit